jgi:molybdopterin/thiamine biosynthesis adenylyltransferase/rhodanese-related sulfurtransferase
MLQKEEISRYNRHLILPEIGYPGQMLLKQARVLVIGAGGLGCPVLQYLAAAGVGTLGIVDFDVVEESNLQRQILFGMQDVGRKKATVAAEKLALLNPFINLTAFTEQLCADNAEELIAAFDLVIDGSDNFATRYLVNDVCVALGKPFVSGSIFQFEGQVSVFNYQGGPTYRCLYPEPSAGEELPNCSETGVLGVLPGMIGLYMANEAIKLICGIGHVLSGKLLVLNALDNTTDTFSIERTAPKAPPATFFPVVSCTANMPVQAISKTELEHWLAEENEVYLVDVREPFEYEAGNIGGINIPLATLSDQLHVFPKNKRVVFCCQNGKRSLAAAHFLKNAKFKGSVFNLTDGIAGSIN